MLNFIYINTHDTGRYIEPYGYAVQTPGLLELAQDATLFTQSFCAAPTCSPSRASMLTSTMAHQNGMLGLAQRGFSLRNPKQHLASYLASKGYETAISGIQHETGWYFDIDTTALQTLGYQHILTTDPAPYRKEDYHLWDHENVKQVIEWLKIRDHSKPFMMSYGMHSTHRPYPVDLNEDVDPRYVRPAPPFVSNPDNRLDQAQFLTSLQAADDNVGLLVQALKELDLYDNTVILFTTDHGLALPFHKCTLKDDGIAVSLMMRHPKQGHGTVVDQLVSHLDVFPTVCDCLGLEKPDYVIGKSFIELFENPEAKIRDAVFAQINFHTSYEPVRCVRTERYKYIKFFDDSWTQYNLSNMDESMPKDFLLGHGLRELSKDMEALYDCYYDPYENKNLIDDPQHHAVVKELRQRLQLFMEETEDPLLDGEIEVKDSYKVNKQKAVKASSKNPDDYDPRGRMN